MEIGISVTAGIDRAGTAAIGPKFRDFQPFGLVRSGGRSERLDFRSTPGAWLRSKTLVRFPMPSDPPHRIFHSGDLYDFGGRMRRGRRRAAVAHKVLCPRAWPGPTMSVFATF